MAVGEPEAPYLELLDVAKHFGGVQALHGASLEVRRGTVHALVGENGAGKSTLGRIVAGVVVPDSGRILLEGEPLLFGSPREALEHKVAAIAQEPSVVPQLTVAENVLLGVEPAHGGFIRRRRLGRSFEALAQQAGFDLRGDAFAGQLGTADQQKVEILRALSRDAQLIVMDEPSAALDAREAEHLYDIIGGLRDSGKTIIFISHFLNEVLRLADAVTVLRDGKIVKTAATSSETEASLIEAMLGRPLTSTFPAKAVPPTDAPVVLSVRDVHGSGVAGASFDLRAGEILGLAGLVGAGRTELGRSPRRSIDAGVAMIPESRKDAGLIFGRSSIENSTLSRLRALSALGFVRRRAEGKAARAVLERTGVRGASLRAPVDDLSGGNQQKVLLARMLFCQPRVVIADEPTRGVDVGAKRVIYDFLAELAADGIGILLISSEVEEIIGLAHRALVMRRGRIVDELDGDAITEGRILAAAFADQSAAA